MKKHLISLLILFLFLSTSIAGISTQTEKINTQKSSSTPTGSPMNSSWPMQSHDVYHTGRSPFSTANNPGTEKWRIHGNSAGGVESSVVIDVNNIIYFGTMGSDSTLYALYSNGTLEWKYRTNGLIWSTSAIADDGTIYLPSWGSHLTALYPNGQVKWDFGAQDPIASSVTIAEDGTIYIGTMAGNLFAINSNGTEQWHLYLGGNLISSPAIGHDNTIYIGTSSNYFYAVNPNGTLRWQFGAGQFKGNPSIASDDTIYAPCSNGYLYAFYPNGTVKWQASTGGSIAGSGVALAEDGTIYIGTELLRAFYPNGTLKWSADVQGNIYGTVPAVSTDGTIYVSAGLSLVAINPDGTEKWRKEIANQYAHSSPSISKDGTVYVGSTSDDYGYLHVFGLGPLRAEADGPYTGTAQQPVTLTGLAFGGIPPYEYLWDFGDGNTSTDLNPTHTYAMGGNYTATFTITDSEGNSSSDTTTVIVDYPFPSLTIIKPMNAVYISNIRLFPSPLPFILGRITVQVTVDDYYPITEVSFIIHGSTQYTDTIPPYEWTWKQRNFRLIDNIYVIAWDAKGRYAEQKMDVIKWF
jgi:outer membrane protein assembly factor BamB